MTSPSDRLAEALKDRYTLERELGAGGMATVYLAADLKHDRKVAIKVLRPELAAVLGAERFVQEIKTTAALSHPHILPLFDSGEAGGFLYYVMPYLQAETIREKLNRETQFGIEEAVRIATEVADALEYAHQHGVIHRDIKPENLLLHNGRPMVMDFGIALAVSAAAGGRMTETGLSLGTPHYMSPEQATADKDITARSDVYSLASVLYEMLTGEPPHMGTSAQQIIMKIVTEDAAPVTTRRKSVPPNVAAAVAKALEKLPADRFDSAARFAEALATPGFTTATGVQAAPRAAPGASRRAYAIGATAGLVAGIAAMLAWSAAQPAPERPVIRYGLAFPNEQAAIMVGGWNTLALSPDGSKMVYVGGGVPIGQLWVKHRDSHDPVPIPGTMGARDPVLSPDGRWIAYRLNSEIRKIAVGGGSSVSLADSAEDQNGGSAWLDDGRIVYVGAGWHLRVVPEDGGVSARAWSSPQADRYATNPTPIPGGVLFTLCSDSCVQVQDLWVLDLESGTAREIMKDAARGWALPTGHVVTTRRDGGVFAAPWHGPSRELRGPAVPLFEGVGVYLGIQPSMDISAAGQLAYIPGAGSLSQLEAVWVAMDGEITAVDPDWTVAMGGSPGWRISPDGRRLAVSLLTDAGEDIWVKELDRGPLTRLTFDEQSDTRPVWAPDGRSILFISDRAGDASNNVYSRLADGTGTVELVLDREEPLWEAQWSADREWLVFREGGTTQTPRNILTFRVGTDSVHPLVTGRFQERALALSPDGRWLAYVSDETGRDEVYVRPFPDADRGKWSVSTGGGRGPLWSRAGDRLFYVSAENQMIAVTFRAEESFSLLRREPLFAIGVDFALPLDNYTEFDIDADDSRFLLFRRRGGDVGGEQAQLIVVENWTRELPRFDER